MDCRVRNVPTNKRVFGRDITNLEQRRSKNSSISEKPSIIAETRNKSRSFDRKMTFEQKDPIT